jgi:hypothetical protein
MDLELSWQIFEKYSNTRFHENPSSANRVVQCIGKANSRFSKLCERASKREQDTQHEVANYKLSNLFRCDSQTSSHNAPLTGRLQTWWICDNANAPSPHTHARTRTRTHTHMWCLPRNRASCGVMTHNNRQNEKLSEKTASGRIWRHFYRWK